MTLGGQTDAVIRLYPQVFLACHRRHARDPRARRLVNANQAAVLDHLDAVEPMNLRALARHMGVTPSTMSLNVDRLERAGYVSRRRAGHDAREVELRLTRAGARLKERGKVLDRRRVAALLDRLGRGERMEALRGLELLARAAAEMRWPAGEPGDASEIPVHPKRKGTP